MAAQVPDISPDQLSETVPPSRDFGECWRHAPDRAEQGQRQYVSLSELLSLPRHSGQGAKSLDAVSVRQKLAVEKGRAAGHVETAFQCNCHVGTAISSSYIIDVVVVSHVLD